MSDYGNKKAPYDENLFFIIMPAFVFLVIATLVMVISVVETKPSKDPFPAPTLSAEASAALIAPPVSTISGGSAGGGGTPVSGVNGEGLALILKNDCVACHKDTVKVLGPAYADVAAKYKGDKEAIKKLVEKVKVGGAGVWGPIPMSPHPALKDEEMEKMVKYILSVPGGKAPEPVIVADQTAPKANGAVEVNNPIFEFMKTKSDCFVCHKDREQAIGPSYLDIAKKYKDTQEFKVLVEKIKKGGVGVWGQVPMIPHPNLTDDEIEKMVKAILTIK